MLKAPPKPDYPVISPFDIGQFDGLILGVMGRGDRMPQEHKLISFPRTFDFTAHFVLRYFDTFA